MTQEENASEDEGSDKSVYEEDEDVEEDLESDGEGSKREEQNEGSKALLLFQEEGVHQRDLRSQQSSAKEKQAVAGSIEPSPDKQAHRRAKEETELDGPDMVVKPVISLQQFLASHEFVSSCWANSRLLRADDSVTRSTLLLQEQRQGDLFQLASKLDGQTCNQGPVKVYLPYYS
ncbi:unnamed protein product [Protopolystoma xenopodis]|uniref:Uncharacterized protein n=1 Tax=Protopolystoma xenopodis TaxID=117903 RepID=A0A448XL11_9PLAT|nr:unnamed protein product [Protopolystoma xenopodis]